MPTFPPGSFRARAPEPTDSRVFFLAAGFALLVYTLTLAPSVTGEDSGELITAAQGLGIAHPPGYPLWCLLGKLFTWIPLRSVAWRVNLLSAVLGAAAVGVLSLLIRRFTNKPALSIVAALLFAFSRDFWSQCVIAEVYSLNVLLILLVILFVLRFVDSQKTRWLYLACFTLGLGLTNHSTLGPLIPVFLLWVFLRHVVLLRSPVLLANLLAAFVLGLSIILYLPIRSATDPVMDWGNPETLSGTLDHILRRQYTETAEPLPRTILGQARLVLEFLKTFAAQFTAAVAPLALAGGYLHFRRERSTFILFSVLFVLTSYGFIWLINYPADRQNLHLTRVFFLPAHAIATVWIGLALKRGLDWVEPRPRRRARSRRLALVAAAGLLLATPLLAHFRANDQSQNYLARDWGENILRSLLPDAIILPTSDHSTFPLIYLQTVEGLRPDVLIGDKYGYIEDRFFYQLFEGDRKPRVPPPLGRPRSEKERYLVEESGRPVYFTSKVRLHGRSRHEIRTIGLVFMAVASGSEVDQTRQRDAWTSLRFHAGSLDREPGCFTDDLILADYHYAEARFRLLLGEKDAALESLRQAARFAFGIKETYNNLGGALAELEMLEEAIPFFRAALAVDPDYGLAIKNLANVYFNLQRYREGKACFERVLELNPENLVSLLGIARAHKEARRPDLAIGYYMLAFRKDPESESLRNEIQKLVDASFPEDSFEARFFEARKKQYAQLARVPRVPGTREDPGLPTGGMGTGGVPGAAMGGPAAGRPEPGSGPRAVSLGLPPVRGGSFAPGIKSPRPP